MISIEELKRIGKLKGITNIGYCEKDYLQELVLFSLSKNTKKELVFKGGTCLSKFYKLDRFSEDLDFTMQEEINLGLLLDKIKSDLLLFGIEMKIKERKEIFDAILISLQFKGVLYNGNENSLANLRIDINKKSSIDILPIAERYNSLYSEIPSLSVQIMTEQEILAEKVRAIISRDKARDVYDLWFLIKRGVNLDRKLIEKKLSHYKKEWNKKEFIEALNSKKNIWNIELSQLISAPQSFEEVRREIIAKLS